MTVARWAKYGHERLYVNADGGRRVGWVDVKSGVETIEIPELAEAFHEALAAYRGEGVAEPPPPPTLPPAVPESPQMPTPSSLDLSALPPPGAAPSVVVPVPPPVREVEVQQEWVDLALNRPGQAARAQAEAELAAMKDRTKVGTLLARLVDAKTDERAWRVGADGEETIGSRLEKLTSRGWHVLHAVPVGNRGSDIDHVLIGPGGIFTVNTKTHPGGSVWVGRFAIKVNGHSTQYLRNSRFEAERASRLLAQAVGWVVEVRPVLVFLTGTLIPNVTVKQQPDDVAVLDRMDIPGAFKRAKSRLTTEQVEEVYEQARRSSTWTCSG